MITMIYILKYVNKTWRNAKLLKKTKTSKLFPDCRNKNALFTFGLSQSCKQISISCLQKIEDIIQGNGIPEQDYVALPMKLPTRCIFDPECDFKGEVEFNEVRYSQSELVSPLRDIFLEEEFFAPEFVPYPQPILALPNVDEDLFFSRPINLGPPGRQASYLSFAHNNYFKR